ncbi:MAG: bifunctional DNA-binding transcriptional regulator/O6-methylguanine-DNA methyltransferase Ada [Caulobacteraceae bacterium]|nr:bifunctional DNA-binding transcriptional regulator/O6-methylguanine-DNA methyltransferase Ada [Caulobacteraceae bacterium]
MLALVKPEPTSLEDEAWAAFQARDRRLRDRYLMGVKTTGIYCRPGCPARMPNRGNVKFFASAEEARAEGYRACRRCKPDETGSIYKDAIARVCQAIDAAEESPRLEEMARIAGLSAYHFHRVFKAETGVTPAAYAAAVKDRRAKAALAGGASVTEAVYDAGYGASSRFYAKSRQRFGMAPARWKDRGAGEHIRVAVAPCSLGQVLVATTDRGVCAVELGEDRGRMLDWFRERFSAAEIEVDETGLQGAVAAVVAMIEHPAEAAAADLPLDVRGTAFQQRVWDALRRIPRGEVWTYGQLAEHLGYPRAARAVGAACGQNRVAVIIPCHRVVGSNGSLTGFAYGVERKEALLKREGAR